MENLTVAVGSSSDSIEKDAVLHSLVDRGNTVIVVSHALDVIKTADWVVDLGPDGGDGGGTLVVAGSPEAVAAEPASYTGRFLRDVLAP